MQGIAPTSAHAIQMEKQKLVAARLKQKDREILNQERETRAKRYNDLFQNSLQLLTKLDSLTNITLPNGAKAKLIERATEASLSALNGLGDDKLYIPAEEVHSSNSTVVSCLTPSGSDVSTKDTHTVSATEATLTEDNDNDNEDFSDDDDELVGTI